MSLWPQVMDILASCWALEHSSSTVMFSLLTSFCPASTSHVCGKFLAQVTIFCHYLFIFFFSRGGMDDTTRIRLQAMNRVKELKQRLEGQSLVIQDQAQTIQGQSLVIQDQSLRIQDQAQTIQDQTQTISALRAVLFGVGLPPGLERIQEEPVDTSDVGSSRSGSNSSTVGPSQSQASSSS